MKGHSRSRTRALVAAVAAVWFPVNVCRAGTTWDGGGTNDNWSTANNWSPNGIPVSNGTAAIVFTGSAGTLPNLDLDWNISSLTFNSAASAFDLGSNNGSALTIGNVGILQASTHSQFIGHTIILNAAQTWTSNPTSGLLTVNGTINTNGHTLTLNAGNDMFLQKVISGSGGLTKNGAGDVTLTAANTYTGTTTVGTGALLLNSPTGNAVPGDLTIGNGSGTDFVTCLDDNQIGSAVGNTITLNDSGVLQLSSGHSDFVRDINFVGGEIQLGSSSTMFLGGTLSSTATSPQASITGAGTLQMEGSKTFNIPDGTAPIDLDIDAVIAQASSGQSLTKTGAGTLRLGKANTFTGGLALNAGTLILDNNDAAGPSNGGILTLAGGTLKTQTSVTIANFVEITGPVTVLGTSASTVMTFSGPVIGSGSLTLDDADQAGIALKLSGSTFSSLSGTVTVKQGNLRLSKPSGFDAIAGDVIVGDGVGAALTAKIFQEASNQIKDTSNVTVKQDGYWFALPSSSETIASLTIDGGGQVGLGTGTLNPGGEVTVNLGDGTPALIDNPVNLGGFNTSFSVASGAKLVLADTVSSGGVTKFGAGTLQFSASNSFASGVTMNAGTIALDAGVTPLGTGTVQFASGSITPVDADRSISNSISLIGSGGTFDCGAFGLTVSGVISGSSSLGKIGTGLLKLTGANTYSGATFITAGTLVVGNNGLGTAAGTTAVSIGATLQLTASYANAEPLTINAAGSAGGGGGALVGNMPGGGGSFAGAITLGLASTIASIAGDFTLRGNINTNGSQLTITGAGNTTIAALITGNGTLNKTGSATLTLTSANTYTGATIVSAGRLLIQNNLTASTSMSISAGTIELATGGAHNRMIHTGVVSITGTGRINLQDNKLITTSPVGALGSGNTYNGMTGLIQSGRNGGGWNGSRGIVTSQSDATSGNFTSIGIATAAQAKGIAATATATATWAGQTVTGTDALIMYTYGGDANLDGKINVDDYGRIDFNVNLGTTGWFNGDFNYDGKINVDDYGIIDFNVGIQGAPFATGAGVEGVTSVPEPAALSAACLAAALLYGRRRRGHPFS